MKPNKIFKQAAWLAATVTALSACEPFSYDAPNINLNTELRPATHTIAEFLAEYATEEGVFEVRPNSGDAHLFSVDTVPTAGADIILNGIITSSDRDGNMYKYLTIQDLKHPEQGLKISIDANSLYGLMPIGQVISLKCNGLAIGKYADMFQLGCVYFNNNSDTRKRGYEPGRMPYPLFKSRVQLHGLPDPAAVKADTMTIAEIRAAGRDGHSRLVVIKNASFTGRGTGYGRDAFAPAELDDTEYNWAYPLHDVDGVPLGREITDPSGETMLISTSQYATFAKDRLPQRGLQGDLTVIVAFYSDNHTRVNEDHFQLNVRSADDFKPYNNNN